MTTRRVWLEDRHRTSNMTMGNCKIKSYASSSEQGPFGLQLRDQSPGAGSEAYGRRQPLPLLIILLQKRAVQEERREAA